VRPPHAALYNGRGALNLMLVHVSAPTIRHEEHNLHEKLSRHNENDCL
jgi:hypothetical protein